MPDAGIVIATIFLVCLVVVIVLLLREMDRHDKLKVRHAGLQANYDERVREAVNAAVQQRKHIALVPSANVLYTVKLNEQMWSDAEKKLVQAQITAHAHKAYVRHGFFWLVDRYEREVAVLPVKNIVAVHTGRDQQPTPVEIKG